MIGSVTRRAEFLALRSNGTRVRHGLLRMTFAESIDATKRDLGTHQVAFAINRKFGNAVERNRARRRLKAAFAGLVTSGSALASPGLYLLIPDRRVLHQSHQEILDALEACLNRLNKRA